MRERERERERMHVHMSGKGAEREGNTELEAGSRLHAVRTEPNMGLELTNSEMGRETEMTFFQRRHTNDQQIHKKVLNISNC